MAGGVELVNGQRPNGALLMMMSPCSRPARAAGLPGTAADSSSCCGPKRTLGRLRHSSARAARSASSASINFRSRRLVRALQADCEPDADPVVGGLKGVRPRLLARAPQGLPLGAPATTVTPAQARTVGATRAASRLRVTGDGQPLIVVADMQPVRLGPLPWRRRPPAFCWISCLKVYRRRALLSFRCGRADRRDAIGCGPMRLLARSVGGPR